MNDKLKTGFVDRLKTAAAAKQALLARMRPQASQVNPQHDDRAELKAAELAAVREERATARAAKKQATAEAEQAVLDAQAAADEAALTAKRGERKERKALSNAEAKTKRDARYAARKARK
ncbi:DUF6481 family protein [Caulobacter sp. NIBR2454]|uniref:DUF6481 family protein n=1 Tax=Caulobacter sp. NIBR2454 TaxID=3015996 RepID=UPI0022B6676E|nr:DUF6481 family protein [Caulobacter sp. NIBR2454]